VICHGIPDFRPLCEGDIVNIDISVFYKGYHGDLNETFLVGEVDKEAKDLIKTTYEALMLAVNEVRPGTLVRDLGRIISKHVNKHGCSVVRSYCGHGIGSLFHAPPNVPHYSNNKAVGVLRPGMVFTIEPMINMGAWQDRTWPDNWTSVTVDGKRSAQFEHTLLVTDIGVDILTARTPQSVPLWWEQDLKLSQNSPLINQRTNMMNDIAGSVPPPPAYPGHGGPSAGSGAGLLRTKISLGGRKPAVVMPFLLMKPELPAPSPINGSMNLLTYYGLDHAWNKFCATNKKMKEELSAFLPHLPGNIDTPGHQDNSSLRSLIDKPPITGKEILPLSTSALAGFKLQPGPIAEPYRIFAGAYTSSKSAPSAKTANAGDEKASHHTSRKKHKRKHERSSRGSEDRPAESGSREEKVGHGIGSNPGIAGIGSGHDSGSASAMPTTSTGEEPRKSKTEDGGSEKKKKKKKDKKRKRSRSPDHASSNAANPPSASAYSTSDFVDF